MLTGFELYPRWVPLNTLAQSKLYNAVSKNIYGIVERNIEDFKFKVRIKYQVEKYISTF